MFKLLKKKSVQRFFKAFGLFLAVLFLYSFAGKRNAGRTVKDIDIVFENGDNLFITYDMVNKLLIQNHNTIQSQQKERLFLNEIENTLNNNAMIENADVFVEVNGDLGVIVRQKTPIARINEKGKVYYLDRNGEKMPLSANYSARVPIVEGQKNEQISPDLYRLCSFVFADSLLQKQIIGITQLESGKFNLKTRLGGQTIELGSLDRLDKKIKKLKVFYQKMISDEKLSSYKSINLMYDKQVVCTKK
ncbi:MAG: hypothetical protein CSA39_01735 [Flavobacteriales bacterium]|nr:MAG: hypothetical protein CSA39_01735 [Flavobacteriales bacterium]